MRLDMKVEKKIKNKSTSVKFEVKQHFYLHKI